MTFAEKVKTSEKYILRLVDSLHEINDEFEIEKPISIDLSFYKIKVSPRNHEDRKKGFVINLKNNEETKSLCLFKDTDLSFSSKTLKKGKPVISRTDFINQFEEIIPIEKFMSDMDLIEYKIYEMREKQAKLEIETLSSKTVR